jgi:hypothetical protein
MWLSRLTTIPSIAITVAAFWIYGGTPAWSGDGGEDAAGLNSALSDLCKALGTSLLPKCPKLPTITQGVLEIAALNNAPPERVRAFNNIAQGIHVDAGNPGRPPAKDPTISTFPVVDTAHAATLSNLLASSTALAFISSPGGSSSPATAAQLYSPHADTFLFGVTSGFQGQPDTAFLFYDNTLQTSQNFEPGQVIANILLQLVVLNSDSTERLVPTTMQVIVPGTGSGAVTDCSASTIAGDFLGNGTPQTKRAADVGLDCAVVFGTSPFSLQTHAIFEVMVPLVVTNATDPLYFAMNDPNSPNLGISPFIVDEKGFSPTVPNVLPAGASIGMAPFAAPMGAPPSCTGDNCTPLPYALCASLPGGSSQDQGLVASVAAFYAIATDGEMRLEAPLAPLSPIVCPF